MKRILTASAIALALFAGPAQASPGEHSGYRSASSHASDDSYRRDRDRDDDDRYEHRSRSRSSHRSRTHHRSDDDDHRGRGRGRGRGSHHD